MGVLAPAAVTAIIPSSAPIASGTRKGIAKVEPNAAPMTNSGVMMPPLMPKPKVIPTARSFQAHPKADTGWPDKAWLNSSRESPL